MAVYYYRPLIHGKIAAKILNDLFEIEVSDFECPNFSEVEGQFAAEGSKARSKLRSWILCRILELVSELMGQFCFCAF